MISLLDNHKIFIKEGRRYFFIKVESIKYIMSSNYHAEVYTKSGKKHIVRITMSDLIATLSTKNFLRVNRSAIINVDEMKEIISEGQGDFSIIMNDNTNYVLSKNYKKSFFKSLGIRS
ncbi:LytR/AlgR family response regulator transcription factor [Flagellimonas meishanensis]|uniref:LytR/AlgR family response regulator transcription factor n=1 Tax=Flagellimonas meishanensis TaxID=2873264 RepID=UPI00223AF6A6|nr:LytTR family DNA-binding domain-containing protein [[Muricauda] meishanensis]